MLCDFDNMSEFLLTIYKTARQANNKLNRIIFYSFSASDNTN